MKLEIIKESLKKSLEIKESSSCLLLVDDSSLDLEINLEKEIAFDLYIIGKNKGNNHYNIETYQKDDSRINLDIKLINEGEFGSSINAHVKKIDNGLSNESIRILNKGKATVKPNLLVEGKNSVANHSSYIGKLSDDEIYYLMTRNIKKKDAELILEKAFLIDEKTRNYLEEINKFLGGHDER